MANNKRFHLSRRGALALMSSMGAGLAVPRAHAATATNPSIKLSEPDRLDYDVVVVGAGFAGVTAAREVSRAGLSTLVLEARHRVGGRTFTSQFAGDQVELGGTWVHWSQPHVWAEISRYGYSLKESAGATPDVMSWLADGRYHRAKAEVILPRVAALFERYCNVDGQGGRIAVPMAHEPFANPDALKQWDRFSLQDRLNQLKLSRADQDLMSPLLTIDCHNDPRQGGFYDQLRWWALGDHDFGRMFDKLGRFKIAQGMNALSTAILNDAKADILLATPVESVVQRDDKVTVTTRTGKAFTARSIVMAVPMNTLKDITFEPALSSMKLAMSSQGHTGSGVKAYVHLKQKVGRWMGTAPYPYPISVAWTEHERPDGDVIVVFGPPGGLDVTDEASVQAALRKLLPGVEVQAVTGYQWAQDPYAKGTWCWYRPQQVSTGLRAMQQSAGRVHFATGDIANGWRGFVDGAIETGLTAARHVRTQLNT